MIAHLSLGENKPNGTMMLSFAVRLTLLLKRDPFQPSDYSSLQAEHQ